MPPKSEMKLREIAAKVGGELIGDGEVEIKGVASLQEAKEGDLTFVTREKYLPLLKKCRASAVILPRMWEGIEIPAILVRDPMLAVARLLELFYPRAHEPLGVSEGAWVSHSAKLGKDVSIYPLVYVGDEAVIGDRVVLYPGVYVGKGVRIGEESVLYPNVVVYEGSVIGKRVILHAGTVIGSDGFGFVKDGEVNVKIPQIGGVEIGDDVELGANCCVDRATFGKTVIGRGVKVDNLVQIAHNVTIGENTIIVAQVGISGSTRVGKNVILAGQAGLVDHITIGDNVMVAAQAGVTKDVPPGEVVSGSPHFPHRHFLRIVALWEKLPEMKKRLDVLAQKVEEMEKKMEEGKS